MGSPKSIRTVMTDTSRIDDLEIRLAHQERMIEDLNSTVTRQWKEIDRLKREVENLSDRLANTPGLAPQDEPPPPHW